MLRSVTTADLEIFYLEQGPADGWPVVLMHGFPYDVHAYEEVAPLLAAQGARVLVPYLRGYGPTRFLRADTPRSGEQAALGHDLLELLDALQLPQALLAGYDWGGRAACIVAALWPQRVSGLVSVNGYNIQNIARAQQPADPEAELRYWYQFYFQSERGRAGLTRHRAAFCELLWKLWSPTWRFDEATYRRSAAAFDNPDFVEIVIHSYRHRYGLVPGDPRLLDVEAALARQPDITVPTITLDGSADGVMGPPAGPDGHGRFSGRHQHRLIEGVGHNLPQEAPQDFARAVLDLARQQHPGLSRPGHEAPEAWS